MTSALVTDVLPEAGDSDVDALRAAIAIFVEEDLISSDMTPIFYHRTA